MTKKLNKLFFYQSIGYKLDSNIYYLYLSSDRSMCYKCKFYSSCPYSYMRKYCNEGGNCIKCFRFIPRNESFDNNVGLYCTDSTLYEYICFRAGKKA